MDNVLPADQHVHTQWSIDAPEGSMRQACERAIELGLPAVTFTDHAELTTVVVSDEAAAYIRGVGGQVVDGIFEPPPLDVAAYLDCVERCRAEFPGLEIRAGVELGDPHLHPEAAAAAVASGTFDLVVGSLHSLRRADGFADAAERYADLPDAEVVREYLAEVTRMIETSDDFAVLAHVNYAARYWPGRQGEYRSTDFEAEYRTALRALARSGRAMEINTSGLPLDPVLLGWWRDEGGEAVSFGSDAHDPHTLGRRFASAAAMAQSAGFGPEAAGPDPDGPGSGLWVRR
jgi:histidinol-phosphatase (PHP family)